MEEGPYRKNTIRENGFYRLSKMVSFPWIVYAPTSKANSGTVSRRRITPKLL
jgi:hypothetical protein